MTVKEKDKYFDKISLNMSKTNLVSEDKYRNLYHQISKKQEEAQELKFKNADLEDQLKVCIF
jgi:hypothetical protein